MRPALIHRYIMAEILPGFMVNILAFTSVMLMARTMQLANLVIARGVGPDQALEIILLAAPRILTLSLPMAALLAILTAFMRLSADSELTILRASGLSLYQLAPPVLVFGAGAALSTALFSLWLAPLASGRFKDELLDLAKARADLAVTEQTFIRSFPGLVMYVGQADPAGGEMNQVFIHDGRQEEESAVILARQGRLGLDRETGTLTLHLEEGAIDRVRADFSSTDSIFFDSYELKLSPGQEAAGQTGGGLLRGRAETPTGELKRAAAGLADPAARRLYFLEWHERWARPAASFLLALIGLPLGASFRAKGRNFPLLTALAIFILYYVVSSLGWSLGEAGRLPPAAGLWAANLLLAGLGAALMKRLNRGAPIDPGEFTRRLLIRIRR